MNQKLKWGIIGGAVGVLVLIIILCMCLCGGNPISWGMPVTEVSEEMKGEGYEEILNVVEENGRIVSEYRCYDETIGSITVTCEFNQKGELYKVTASGIALPYEQFVEYLDDEYGSYDIYFTRYDDRNAYYGVSDDSDEASYFKVGGNTVTWFNKEIAPATEKALFAQTLSQLKQKEVD
ncbi:MAG: hypothetical protein IKJ55_05830 [Clostridia bacterium]|nr:hypothetical protein [Clostridia bacterium]